MSQPRRRRRRRRKSGPPSDQNKASEQRSQQQQGQQQKAAPGRRRRRRGRARGEQRQAASPKSSEDLVRALPKQRPATLTAPADGQSLEGIIGELQSQYGVPQYPQEYRITIKVADERDSRGGEQTVVEERKDPEPKTDGGPKREKAPAPPVLMRDGTAGPSKSKRRRGRRGRRRRGGGAGGGGSPAS